MSTDADPSPFAGDDLHLTLFERYWLGETSPAEAAQVDAWFRAHPERHEWFARFGATLTTDYYPSRAPEEWTQRTAAILQMPQVWTSDTRLGLVGGGIAADDRRARRATEVGRSERDPFRMKRLGWMGRGARAVGFGGAWAAAILVFFAASFAVVRQRWNAGQPHAVSSTSSDAAVREITTRRGQRAELRLADGSRVVLAPESRLRIPVHAERDLELEGEAYFDVVHDATRPFRVRTAMGIAEDIGTSFVVSAYPELRGMHVAVESGIVALRERNATSVSGDTARGPAAPVMLERGDVGRLDAGGHTSVTHHADLAAQVGWVNGRLVLDGVPFAEAVPRLERWYDLHIELTDSAIARARLVMTFESATEASYVIQRLALATATRAERQGRTVRFVHP